MSGHKYPFALVIIAIFLTISFIMLVTGCESEGKKTVKSFKDGTSETVTTDKDVAILEASAMIRKECLAKVMNVGMQLPAAQVVDLSASGQSEYFQLQQMQLLVTALSSQGSDTCGNEVAALYAASASKNASWASVVKTLGIGSLTAWGFNSVFGGAATTGSSYTTNFATRGGAGGGDSSVSNSSGASDISNVNINNGPIEYDYTSVGVPMPAATPALNGNNLQNQTTTVLPAPTPTPPPPL